LDALAAEPARRSPKPRQPTKPTPSSGPEKTKDWFDRLKTGLWLAVICLVIVLASVLLPNACVIDRR